MYWRTVWARLLSRVQESARLVSGPASHVTNTGAVLHCSSVNTCTSNNILFH